MTPLGSLLRGVRLGRNWDEKTMAKAIGTTARRVQQVEAGRTFPPAAERRLWALRLGFSDLTAFDRQWRDGWARVTSAHKAGWVPVINKAPAGPPVDYTEFGVDSGVGYEYVPRSAGQNDEVLFAVIIFGDSMCPGYREGDLVIFRPVGIEEPIADGSAVFIRFSSQRDHACTFKTLYRRPDGRFDLRPENPSHVCLCVATEEIDRMALAIERRPAFWRPQVRVTSVADEFAQEFPEE